MITNLFFTLIVNIALMVSFVYILNRIKPFSLNPSSPLLVKIYYSVGFVILSALTMKFSFNDNGVLVDFRFVPVMVAGLFGGPVTGAVTGLLVGIFRLSQLPDMVTVIIGISTIILGIVIGLFSDYQYRKNKYLLIPALMGTLVVVMAGFILTFWPGLKAPDQYHYLFGLLHPLAFIFMVLILKDLIKLNEHRLQLEREATVDGMTGLFNFRYFDNSLKTVLESAVKRSEKLTVAFIDIDHFKKVNDTYGHQAGDEVLRQLGEVIRQSLRPFDIAARYGGEEFAAILPGSDAENALNIGDRIRRNVENKVFHVDGIKIRITVSIGVTTFPDFAQNDDELISQSDAALYRAKETGRNKVICYCEIAKHRNPIE